MSRATLRAALVTFLSQNVAGIKTVYSSFPKTVLGTDMMDPTVPSGCFAVISFGAEREQRVALGGPHSGEKRVDSTVELHLFFRSTRTMAEDAMGDFDALVENVKTLIRSDRTIGGGAWQAGEDMNTRYSDPVMVGQNVDIWGVVVFTATEWLVGT
ncbi:MAG TPA: hypothetical protein VMT43_06590 [Acidimicrobiales bacterium]|nr:hypothetical protein [Acidimicrobiales bacterium]